MEIVICLCAINNLDYFGIRVKENRGHMVTKNFGLNCFKNLNEEVFHYASSHNLKCIEIHLDKTHITLESFTPQRINEINTLAGKHEVSLSLHSPYTINPSDIISFFRKIDTKYLLKSIHLAEKLEASYITAHIGSFYWFPVEKWTRSKALNRFIKSMGDVVESCEKSQVSFALENVVPIPHASEYYYLGDNIEDFKYLFDHLHSDYFMMCLDTGHANMGEGVISYIENFGTKIKSIHYHDNHGKDDNHLPVGEGTINWVEVGKALNEIDYDGPLISECRQVKPHEAALLLSSFMQQSK